MSLANVKQFKLYDSNVDKEYIISNLARFSREHNLNESCMRDVLHNRQIQHKGFYLTKLEVNVKPFLKKKTKQERYNQSDEFVDFQNRIKYYHKLYHIEQQLSCKEIADIVGANTECIRRLFHKNNLQVIKYSKPIFGKEHHTYKNYTEQQKVLIDNFLDIFTKEHFEEALSIKQIAKKYNLNTTTLLNYCRAFGIEYKSKNISFHHSLLVDFLKENNIQFETNNREIIKPKELDIYLPEYKLGIEINGLYWHSENKLDKNYHLNKLQLCQNVGIDLIQFWDVEIEERFDIIKSILSMKLKLNNINKIYARQTEIKKLSYSEIRNFLLQNHIQGERSSGINYGLFYNSELVMIATFNHSRKYSYELVRLCSKLYTNVIGGASKLLKQFKKEYDPESIVSYCDKRIFNGNIYSLLGFQYLGDSLPNYFYFSDNEYKLLSRIRFQKHKLNKKLLQFDEDKSEVENMKNNNYDRVFDCGNKIYQLISSNF